MKNKHLESNRQSLKYIIRSDIYAGKDIKYFWMRLMKHFLYPSDQHSLLIYYRIGQRLHDTKFTFLSKYMKRKMEHTYGCYISFKSSIGVGLRLPHPIAIVIGDGVIIGDNCSIYQSVTLGQSKVPEDKYEPYPVVGDQVTIYAGAKVIGNVRIGHCSTIGANAVVLSDVENNEIVVGIPAASISKKLVQGAG